MELLPGIYDQILIKIFSSKLNINSSAIALLIKYFKKLLDISLAYVPDTERIDFISSIIRNLSNKLNPDLEIELVFEIILETFLDLTKEYGISSQLKHVEPLSAICRSSIYSSVTKPDKYVELKREIKSADKICIIISSVRDLSLIARNLQEFIKRGGVLNILTGNAQENITGAKIKVIPELKFKAATFIFIRKSGFHTAFVNSSSLMDKGKDWSLRATQFENPDMINSIINSFESHWR